MSTVGQDETFLTLEQGARALVHLACLRRVTLLPLDHIEAHGPLALGHGMLGRISDGFGPFVGPFGASWLFFPPATQALNATVDALQVVAMLLMHALNAHELEFYVVAHRLSRCR